MASQTKKTRAKSQKSTTYRGEDGVFGNRGTAFTAEWLALASAYGGVTQLAAALGSSYSTLHRWAVNGDPVPETKYRFIIMLAATKGLAPPPRERK